MPITNTSVTVNCAGNGSAGQTLLVNADGGSPAVPIAVTVYNPAVAAVVYIGGSTVTTSNGVPLAAGGSASFQLSTGNNLYAVMNSVTTTVAVMKSNS